MTVKTTATVMGRKTLTKKNPIVIVEYFLARISLVIRASSDNAIETTKVISKGKPMYNNR